MKRTLAELQDRLIHSLGDTLGSSRVEHQELTMVIMASEWKSVALRLRDDPEFQFETLIDLTAVDYQTYGEGSWDGPRFAVVMHLLSLTHNCRVRVKTFLESEEFPKVDSVVSVWPSANWYEREAFDLFGVVFDGHPDLRRLLTDYGFIGHPFRKDFPVIGHLEMRYDDVQKRVIYHPVTIEHRENVPRIVREPQYADNE